MKKIFYILIAASLAFSACNDDLLDKQPLDQFSEIAVWSDGNIAQGFVFDIYGSVVKNLYANQRNDGYTDNEITQDNGTYNALQFGTMDNGWDMGWNQYGNIRKCNLAIEKLTGNESIESSMRDNLLGEAYMLRAMIYADMAKKFGGVMLVDKVLTPEDEMKLPRATEAETYALIESDIEKAIPLLPSSAPKSRLTKAAAFAFMTEVGLYSKSYDKVIAAADELEKLTYSLDNDYSNMFASYAGTTTSPEVIFLFESGSESMIYMNTRMFWNYPNVENGAKLNADAVPQLNDAFLCWPNSWPSQELVDAYLVKENGQSVQKTWQEYQGKPARLMWKNRDNRFEKSIVRDSSVFRNSTLTFRRGGNMHWTSNPLSTWGMPKSGYMFRKWAYEQDFVYFDNKVTWAEPLFRLGRVYLNKAEAYGRKENIAKAVEYMNKTRTVHGGLPALAITDALTFWRYYKIERRVELVQENDRYWSLIRWAKAENATNIPELNGYKLHGLDMAFDGIVNVVESSWTSQLRCDLPKRFYFPIPNAQIKANTNLKQNPGWE